MTILLFGALFGMTALWILIIAAFPFRAKIWFCRHQWAFLLFHVPVMYFMSFIGGEGLIFGLASLIGGILGQFWLAFWGTKHGLTFVGKKTPKYKEFKRVHVPVKYRLEIMVLSRLLSFWGR